MAADPGPFLASLAAAIAQWRRRGRLADLLPPLFDLGLARSGAERALCFTEREDGGYLVHGSRDTDGDPLPDAERWISNFAVMRAAG